MNRRQRVAFLGVIISAFMASNAVAQPGANPSPPGERLIARDGDVVVVEGDARVMVVRRRVAQVRAVFDSAERWLLLLLDHATPDGLVDEVHHYRGVEGEWPLGARWNGAATFETYSSVANGPQGHGLLTPQGLVRLNTRQSEFQTRDAIAVLTFRGGGSQASSRIPFDEAETLYAKEAGRDDRPFGVPVSGGVSLRLPGGFGSGNSVDVSGGVARVGGPIRSPKKIVDVTPVPPEGAVPEGIRATVLFEITVAVDGKVSDVRVLRSSGLPKLDAAALDAVRQWRYEPTTYNGKPLSVIMRVSVAF